METARFLFVKENIGTPGKTKLTGLLRDLTLLLFFLSLLSYFLTKEYEQPERIKQSNRFLEEHKFNSQKH